MKRKAVIIGVGQGLGKSLAKRFARGGYNVVISSRNVEKLKMMESEIQKENSEIEVSSYAVDSSNEESIKQLFSHIKQTPDILIYNTAQLEQVPSNKVSTKDFEDRFRTNVVGAFVSVQQVREGMKQRGSGSIFLTSGGLAKKAFPGYLTLSVGKAAIRAMAQVLHGELKRENIHVSSFTISGFIKEQTSLDPNLIAEKYWEMHNRAKNEWVDEIVIT